MTRPDCFNIDPLDYLEQERQRKILAGKGKGVECDNSYTTPSFAGVGLESTLARISDETSRAAAEQRSPAPPSTTVFQG